MKNKMRHNHIPLTSEQYKRLKSIDYVEQGETGVHMNIFWHYCKMLIIKPTDKQKLIISAIFRNAGYWVDNGKLYSTDNYRIA